MMKKKIPNILSIAGSDSSGGAGIQADIKAISANGGYAASVITALTAQNSRGVQAIYSPSIDFLEAQLHSVFSDISFDAIKIGMLHSQDVVQCVLAALENQKSSFIVLDPVMYAKGGATLLSDDVIEDLKTLFYLCDLLTPNILEAERLLSKRISTKNEMSQAASELSKMYELNVLLKGGHLKSDDCDDVLVLWKSGETVWFPGKRINTQNTHGTGCSLSSAIACNLAKGLGWFDAVNDAIVYIKKAIAAAENLNVGNGHGPIQHFFKDG